MRSAAPYPKACFRAAQGLRSGTGLPTGLPRDEANADAVKWLKRAAELGGGGATRNVLKA